MSSSATPAARTVADRFSVGTRRGSGLEVATFEATDLTTGEPVVLKLVHPRLVETEGFAERFEEVMSAVAGLDNPSLARIIDHGPATWNGNPVLYVASEQFGGGSLRDLLDRKRLLSPSQALMVGLGACRGLDALHRAGRVHGDIRPATLVFGADGQARIVDLGLSELLGSLIWEGGPPRQELATYASPERATGQQVVPASDIYSLALTVIEAATGRVPFIGDSAVSTLDGRVDRLLPVSADLGPLAAVLERAGRPHPEDRWTAAGFGAALLQAAQKMPRPEPIPILSGGLFSEQGHSPADPTFPTPRPAAPDEAVAEAAPAPESDQPASPAPERPAVLRPQRPTGVSAPHDPLLAARRDAAADADAADAGGERAGDHPDDDAQPPVFDVPDAEPAPMPTLPEMVAPSTVDASGAPASTSPIAIPVNVPDPSGPTPRPSAPAPAPGREPVGEPTTVRLPTLAPGAPPRPARRRRGWLWALWAFVAVALAAGGLTVYLVTRTVSHTMPALRSTAQADASAAVEQLKFVPVLSTAYDEEVPAGGVIRTEPDAGAKVPEKTKVSIVVSRGPQPRIVPNLTAVPLAAAGEQLQSMALRLEQDPTPVFDEQVAAGSIVSFAVVGEPDARAGAEVPRGSTIKVVVSQGPKPREVPQLVGTQLADAQIVVGQLGLVLDATVEVFDPSPKGQIVEQQPGAKGTVARGGTVKVVVSKGPEMIALPTPDGRSAAQFIADLRAAGFVVGSITGDPAKPLQSMNVGARRVAPGEAVAKGSTIDLNFTA